MTAIRAAEDADIPALARLWHHGWTEAHAAHVPAELTAQRTLESFETRLGMHQSSTRTAGPIGAPLGLCLIKANKIDQIYVAPEARGTGLAADLIADGLVRIRAAGFSQAELEVIPENSRALAFYEKQGWKQLRVEDAQLETLGDPFALRCIIMGIHI